jgi:PHD/YefM family antitoxin component YafN of YafNO toxin-antitoxin module
MNVLQDVITAESLAQRQVEVFEDILTSSVPKVIIYEGQPAFLLIRASDYQAQLARLSILEKMLAGREDVQAGRVVPNDQVITELQNRIQADGEAKD